MTSNDNDATPRESPSLHDARGHAALLLVESLIHGLCENATLSTAEAIAIADRAICVPVDWAHTGELAMSATISAPSDDPAEKRVMCATPFTLLHAQ